jgi:hypothetical protein
VVATPGQVYDVSPDGSTIYVAENYHVIGRNIATGSIVYDSGVLFGFPDGIGVISSNNALNGKLIVNFNGVGLNAGFVGLLDRATNTVTTIASGAGRGATMYHQIPTGRSFYPTRMLCTGWAAARGASSAKPRLPLLPRHPHRRRDVVGHRLGFSGAVSDAQESSERVSEDVKSNLAPKASHSPRGKGGSAPVPFGRTRLR